MPCSPAARARLLLCLGVALAAPGAHAVPATGLVPVGWTDTVAAVPGTAVEVWTTVSSRVRPMVLWSEAQLARVPGLYAEGQGLVLGGLNRLRAMPLPTAPDYAAARRL